MPTETKKPTHFPEKPWRSSFAPSEAPMLTENPSETSKDDHRNYVNASDATNPPAIDTGELRQAFIAFEQPIAQIRSGKFSLSGYEIQPLPLGRGGQGTVYVAHQRSTRRTVAIKLLHIPVEQSEEALRRFQREVELVAQLDHPFIVKIFESGIQPNPYYVMEYIDGVTLTDYVASKQLDTKAILRLMLDICEGVQFAHQNGVIHRDLKPQNILVDSQGKPKIVDFGLAKQLGAAASITMGPSRAGTLAYMAPEQATGKPGQKTDTRTDTYALGVILYRLLTGAFPYPVNSQELPEEAIRQHILYSSPRSPQAAWQQGKANHIARESFKKCPIDHELTSLLQKSLAKDSDRRYRDAGALAEDLQSYLQGQPIRAIGDSRWYFLKKSLYRYRGWVLLIATFVGVITTAAGWLAVLYHEKTKLVQKLEEREQEALQQRENAEKEASKAKTVSEFLRGLFSNITVGAIGQTDVRLVKVLAAKSQEISKKFAEQPEIAATLHNAIGHYYWELSRFDDAHSEFQKALEVADKGLGENHPLSLESLRNVGFSLDQLGRLYEAEEVLRRAYERQVELLGISDKITLYTVVLYGATLWKLDKVEQALELLQEPRKIAVAQYGINDQSALLLEHIYGTLLITDQKTEDAEQILRKVWEGRIKTLGPSHNQTLTTMNNLGLALRLEKRYDEAELHLRETVKLAREQYESGHWMRLMTEGNLAQCLCEDGKAVEALNLYETIFVEFQPDLAPARWRIARIRQNYGECLISQKEFEKAKITLLVALEGYEGQLPKHHSYIRELLRSLIEIDHQLNNLEDVSKWEAELSRREAAKK